MDKKQQQQTSYEKLFYMNQYCEKGILFNINEDINFEDAMKQLESIANELEKGNLTLDESVKKFEEGMNLSKKCNNFLNSAEKKITMLINEGGEIKEDNFVPKED